MTEQNTPKMTHDEMIDTLKGLVFGTFDRTTAKEREALDMAIKALEQEPSGETVSLEAFKQVMWERDIAIAQLKELGYGFGQKIEPKTGHWEWVQYDYNPKIGN